MSTADLDEEAAGATCPSSLLRRPAFRRFWLARGLAVLGNQCLSVALGWQLYDLTRDPLSLGLVGLVQFGPTLLLTLPAGHVADRARPQLVLALCQAACAAAPLALALASARGHPAVTLIYALVTVLGAARAFDGPAGSVILGGLVPRHDLARAMASDSSIRQTAMIAGPGIGGLLYGLGPSLTYGACGLAYGAALLLVLRLPGAAGRQPAAAAGALLAGIGFIRTDRAVQGAMWLDLLAILLGSTTALLPVFARDILRAGPVALGLLRGASAVGAVLTALALSRRPLQRRAGPVMLAAVGAYALTICVFALSRSLAVSLVALALMGAADQLSVSVRNMLVQLRTPDHLRGRVSAVSNVFLLTSVQLGDFRAGLVGSWFGAVPGALVAGLSTLALAGLGCRLLPALRRVDRLEEAAE